MSKIFANGEQLKQKVLEGINVLADNVAATMGPRGRNVIIMSKDKKPVVSKDGVTIARAVSLEEPVANAAVQILKQAAEETVNAAGDGPQPLWSKVLTPNGFVEMRDLCVGMDICGTNGTIQKVLGVFDKGEREIYEVSFKGGRTVECCSEHLWGITTNYGSKKILTTNQMMSNFKKVSENNTSFRYWIPKTEVEFNKNSTLPLDPYLLGVLIGDGSLRDCGSIELSLGFSKKHILSKLNLPVGFEYHIGNGKNSYRVKITGKNQYGQTFRELLEPIGLRNTNSDTKFIPEEYLMSSRKDRLALLQGLIDTDGHINCKQLFEFSTVSLRLYEDFLFLVRSLGISIYSRKQERKPGNGSYSNKSIFRVCELKGYRFGDQIINIKPTGKITKMQCIKVSNPDSLYITDDFIVTHNTTSSTVLARSILFESQPFLAASVSPIELKRGIDKTVSAIIEKLKTNSVPVRKLEDVRNVATISANGDTHIGDLISQAVDLTGKDGAVNIREGKNVKSSLELVEGFRFKSGFAIPHFITNERLGIMKHENPLFLITDEKIDDIQQLLPSLELAARAKRPFIIVADDVTGAAIAAITLNAVRGTLKVAVIKAPSYGKERFNILSDLALSVGATFFTVQNGNSLSNLKLTDFGQAKTIESNKIWTTVVGGNGDADLVSERIESLREEIKVTDELPECEKISERISRLSSGVAIIHVGGSTEVEMIETKHRIEDALEAVKSAQEEGILDGGGIALLKAFKQLKPGLIGYSNDEQKLAYKIMAKVTEAPLRQMLKNAGESSDVILQKVKKTGKGYNIVTRKYCDLIKQGIIDPCKVTRIALQNAASVATTLITTDFAIIDN